MKVILLVLAAIEVFLYACNHVTYNAKYGELIRNNSMSSKIIGGIVAAIINIVACWYVVKCIVEQL